MFDQALSKMTLFFKVRRKYKAATNIRSVFVSRHMDPHVVGASLVGDLEDLPGKKCCLRVAWKVDDFCLARQV